ncbi:MAG: hypothetical protein SGARI_006066 [Bacillariaceae sp.]
MCSEFLFLGALTGSSSSSTQSSSISPSASPIEYIEDSVNSHDVVIFSDWNDLHCQTTEQLLEEHYGNLHLDHYDVKVVDLPELQEEAQKSLGPALQSYTGQPTLPHVFVGGRFVGGYYQTKRALQRGDLQRYLREQEEL